jgi:hypothetical protein
MVTESSLLRTVTYPVAAAVIVAILIVAADLWGPYVLWLWLRRGPAEVYSVLASLAFSAYAGWRVIGFRVGGWIATGLAGVAVLALAQFLGQGSVLLGLSAQKYRSTFFPSFLWALSDTAARVGWFSIPAFVSGVVGGAVRRLFNRLGVADA